MVETQTIAQAPNRDLPARGGLPRRLAIGGATLGALGLLAIVLVHHFWPFSQDQIATSLQDAFSGSVTFQAFHATYFPHPGCVAEGVVFHRKSREPGLPPFATVQRLTIQAHYLDILLRPGVVALVRLEGLHLQVPPRGSIPEGEGAKPTPNRRIGAVVADGAVLDILRADGGAPLRFEIHKAKLSALTHDGSLNYDVTFRNPLPLGEMHSTGNFGPWKSDVPGQTPLSGRYTFEQADLSVFPGISGMMSSEDDFSGVLGHIETHGTVEVPDFEVDRSGHTVPLHSTFQAVVNGTNGDVELEKVETKIGQTAVATTGRIAGKQGQSGKTVSLIFRVNQGRIQDLLRLFVSAPKAPLTGTTSLSAKVTVPPDGQPFFRELQLDGDFQIDGGKLTTPETQSEVAILSERARGEKDKDVPPENADDVISSLRGHASVRNGTATLTDVYFEVPGAKAKVNGTYGLLDQKMDFHGKLETDVKISQATTGFKSVLLKPFDPLFRGRKHPGVVPVKLVGPYSKPEAGLDIIPK
jgi:hypothetical protein